MFNNIRNTIFALNSDAKNVANSHKAKKLKRNLLCIGFPLAILGFVGVIVCMVLFATAGMNAFSENGGFTARVIVPFVLFLPCGLVAGIGSTLINLGFSIVISAYTTNLIDEVVVDKCTKCGKNLLKDENYCSKCGAEVKKECLYCHHINDKNSSFCEQCGNKLK